MYSHRAEELGEVLKQAWRTVARPPCNNYRSVCVQSKYQIVSLNNKIQSMFKVLKVLLFRYS